MRTAEQVSATVPDQRAAVDAVRALKCASPVAALAHLMTPVSAVIGVDVRLSSAAGATSVAFRGRRVTLAPGLALDAVAVRIGDLVHAVAAGDSYLDVAGHPSGWLKPVRSGAWVVLGGARELFAGPEVLLDPAVAGPGVVRALGATLASGNVPLPGATLPAFGVRVRGNRWRVILEPERTAGTATSRDGRGPSLTELLFAAAESCADLQSQFGAVHARWLPTRSVFPGTVSIVGELDLPDGSRVEVPVIRGAHSVMAGVPVWRCAEVVAGAVAPRGFVDVGLRLPDGGEIVEHGASGVRAALRRPPAEPGVTGSEEGQ